MSEKVCKSSLSALSVVCDLERERSQPIFRHLDRISEAVFNWRKQNLGAVPDFIIVHPVEYHLILREIVYAGYCGNISPEVRWQGVRIIDSRSMEQDQIEIVTKTKR